MSIPKSRPPPQPKVMYCVNYTGFAYYLTIMCGPMSHVSGMDITLCKDTFYLSRVSCIQGSWELHRNFHQLGKSLNFFPKPGRLEKDDYKSHDFATNAVKKVIIWLRLSFEINFDTFKSQKQGKNFNTFHIAN